MYATGQGVPQDYVQAHMWFSLSLALGNPLGNGKSGQGGGVHDPGADCRRPRSWCGRGGRSGERAVDRDRPAEKRIALSRVRSDFWYTPGMQFGIFGSAQASTQDLGPETGQGFRDYLDYAVEAEALGYRSSFLVEHHFTGWNQVSATLMLQTALAMRTTTLRLGTAVIVLPWHNPVLLAEQAATLDLISGGRLDFGIGKGYRHNEFAGFRIPPEEAEPRFEESVEVMTKAFVSRERFSHRGKFWQFDDIVVEPPPSQKPHPPFWVAAGSEASIRSAAQRGFNLILDQYASPEVLGQRIALYRAEREPAACANRRGSRSPARPMSPTTGPTPRRRCKSRRHGTKRTVAVSRAPDGKTGSHVLSYAATPQGTEANALYGTPDEICETLASAASAGVEYVILTMLGGKEQLRRFAREVMPAFADRRRASLPQARAKLAPLECELRRLASCQRHIPLRR